MMNKGIKFLMVILVTAIFAPSPAQINTAILDSIPFSKPKRGYSKYEFNHAVLTKASISKKRTKRGENSKYSTKQAAKDLAGDFASAFFGGFFVPTTTEEVEWLIRGTIHCNQEWLNWDIEVYCSGEINKEKIRKKNTDGTKTLETITTIIMDWEGGASAFIIENDRPIGQFMIINNPRRDSLFYHTNKDVFDQPKIKLKSTSKNKFYNRIINMSLREYAVVGKFREENFVLIANGVTRNMWFFVNNKLVCFFQPDLDEFPLKKKDRIMPYILVDSEVTNAQLVDWFRLALVSKYLSTTIGRSSY